MESVNSSSSTPLSNTVCFADPNGEWLSVQESVVEELSQLGEIARLDTSLALVLRCVLVTYFDVRCAQQALTKLRGRTESFLPGAHDCRMVRVKLQAFAEKMDGLKGFGQFGEVANISMHRGDAIVEFYDMRAAQFLLASVGSCATPWTTQQAEQQAAQMRSQRPESEMLSRPGLWGGDANSAAFGTRIPPAPRELPVPRYTDVDEVDPFGGKGGKGKGGHRHRSPVRMKVPKNEFQDFDIDPQRIASSADGRTTVMVRNLAWASARKDFLAFLDECGMSDSYTFFYMPCKKHQKAPAGIAFMNLCSSNDVLKLYGAIDEVTVSNGWRQYGVKSANSKTPAMSYASFQGHDSLVYHFSSSAVLREPDPERRPIFRTTTWDGEHGGQFQYSGQDFYEERHEGSYDHHRESH